MKRPDADTIRKIKKAKGLDTKRLKEVLDLPYFYMSYKMMNDFEFDAQELPEQKVLEEREDNRALVRSFANTAELVYDEFVLTARNRIQLEHDDHYEVVDVNYWGYVKERDGGDSVYLVIEYPDTKQIMVWEGRMVHQDTLDENGVEVTRISPRMDPDYEKTTREWHRQMLAQNRIGGQKDFHDFIKGISQQAGIYYMFIGKLMHYLKYGDKHAVEVVPENPKPVSPVIARDRPWVTATGPRVLLLDRMPATQSQGTGTHASPKPHRRRGHWKTLSHPRFRHHPKYGKKIYVKPSFVGPRQVSYEGNIYRLIEPLDDALA